MRRKKFEKKNTLKKSSKIKIKEKTPFKEYYLLSE